MRNLLLTSAFAAAMTGAFGALPESGITMSIAAQTAATTATQEDKYITPNRVVGEVTAIEAAAKSLSLKTDAGSVVAVALTDQTAYMRLPPGETTLTKATEISFGEIGVGDRVLALGRVADDKKSVPARVLVVMTKTDLAQKHERDREEWQRRGITGTVSAIDPATKEITATVRSREGNNPVIISAGGEKVAFRRYAPNSVKFNDAVPSSFAELKVGDQLRALGDKSADGTHLTSEEIVFGSFRILSGTVTSVNPQTNEVKIKSFADNKELAVSVNGDSIVRRLPEQVAAMMAARAGGGGNNSDAAAGGTGAGRPPRRGGATGAPDNGGASPAAGRGGNAGPGGGGGSPRGGFDLQDALERMPAIGVADLKPGDVVLFNSTVTNDPSHATAITMIAGLDAFANMMRQGSTAARRGGAGGEGMGPSSTPPGLDLGIGLP